MKKFLFLMLIPTMVAAQQTINGLNVKGKLNVISTTKSSNPCPSMTEAQRDSIAVPDIGSCVYNTSDLSLNVYDGAEWKSAGGGGISLWLTLTNYKTDDVVIDSNKIYKSLNDHTSGVFATDLANGNWVEISASEIVDLTTDVTGVLPIANGGTGASTKNFVDLTTNQSAAGDKTFTGQTTFSNRVTMTDMINIDRPAGIVKTDSSGNIEVGTVNLPTEVVGSLPQNNGGNGNLIPTNASFELSPVNTDWTCSAIVPSASGAAAVDGAQGITFTASSASQGCTRYVSMHEGNVGKLLEYSMYVKSTGGNVEVCSINDSVVSNCKTYTVGQSTDVTKIIVTDRPKNTNSNANGILFRTKTATSTTFFGDLAYIGLPKSAEAVMAKFQVDSRAVPCTFSTLAWQGLGTVTNNLMCERVGSRLLINGSLNTGTVASAIAQMPLPTNFGTITVAPTGVAGHTHIGTFFRGATATNKGGALLIRPDLSNLIEFSSSEAFGTSSVAALAPANGNSIFASSERFSFSASIPIAEWSDSYNAALAVCEKGPIGCGNVYSATINGTTPSVISANKAGWITSVTRAATGNFTLNLSPQIGLTVAMSCTANGTTASYAEYETFPNSTTTSIQVMQGNHLPTTNQVASNANFNIICVKNAPDYNESLEKFAGFLPMNDVKSTEWVVGYDWIDNKPIYKRCHKVVSDVTNGTVLTWPASLNPVKTLNYYQDRWLISTTTETVSTEAVTVYYMRNTGVVNVRSQGSGMLLKAGSKFCMEYTR